MADMQDFSQQRTIEHMLSGANGMTETQRKTLARAYALMQDSQKEEKNVMQLVADGLCEPDDIWFTTLCTYCSLVPNNMTEPEVTRTFFDRLSGRYFESTLAKVLEAQMALNRDYVLNGAAEANHWCEYLGLPRSEKLAGKYWSCDSGIYWLDFNNVREKLDDGMEIIVIEVAFAPWEEEE